MNPELSEDAFPGSEEQKGVRENGKEDTYIDEAYEMLKL